MLVLACAIAGVLAVVVREPRTVPGWVLLGLAGWWVWVVGAVGPVQVGGAAVLAVVGAGLVVWPFVPR